MKVLVIGGTVFAGRRTVRQLKDAGHDVAVLHRGTHEPDDLGDVVHIHGDRNDLAPIRSEIDAFAPDVVWDNISMFGRQAEHVVQTLGARRYVVTSSVDVYAAYGALHAGTATEPLPIDETSPVRTERYPYRGQIPGMDDYDKLDVEDVYRAAGATVLRWPMVYGPFDGQRREEFILARVRAGRERIPTGSGMWLATKGFVEDVATASRLAICSEDTAGEVFNVGETVTYPMGLWARLILEAAGSGAELVRVPDAVLPEDLGMLGAMPQHLLVDASKARRMLGFENTDARDALRTTVEWHLANPPAEQPGEPRNDFSADDTALAEAG